MRKEKRGAVTKLARASLPRRRFRRFSAAWYALFGIAIVLVMAMRYFGTDFVERGPEALAEGEYRIARVVDGDTLLLANRARIRLIGVDTPETKKPDYPVERWGPEASRFTEGFLRGGRARLTFDRERLDRYGRFLAYVWVGDRMLNEELIRAGLGRAVFGHPYSAAMKTRFRRAQEEAKQKRLGLWSLRGQFVPIGIASVARAACHGFAAFVTINSLPNPARRAAIGAGGS